MKKFRAILILSLGLLMIFALTGCEPKPDNLNDKLKKAGYTVEYTTADTPLIEEGLKALGMTAQLSATMKDGDNIEKIFVAWFENGDDAKKALDEAKKNLKDGWKAARKGNAVATGTTKAMKKF